MFYIVAELYLVMLVLRIYPTNHHRLAFASIMLIAFVGGLWAIREFYRSLRHAYREASQLPYVPPVTADTLPVEEVLVRGSEEPAQEQSQVLLRGTDGSAGAGEQELLRRSQGQERLK